MECVHFCGLPFAKLATPFGAQNAGCHKAGMPMEPASRDYIARKSARVASQIREHDLGHVLGSMCVAPDQPERRRIDHVEVAIDQFAKSRVRAALDILGKQLLVVRHFNLLLRAAAAANRTKIYTPVPETRS